MAAPAAGATHRSWPTPAAGPSRPPPQHADAGRSIPAAAIPVVVGVVGGALYVRFANPAVGGGNSGEFQVMAHLLGVAHPPSYPLYLLLAKGASLLPLPGDVAWRINVLTALLAAAAVWLVGVLALLVWPWYAPAWPERQRVRVHRSEAALAAGVAGVATAAMPRLWTLAVEAEVFSLHLMLVLAFWVVLAHWQRALLGAEPGAARRADRLLLAASVLTGLGLANHRTFLFIATGGWLLILFTRPRTLARPTLLIACAAFVLVGLSPYLYVLRGAVAPVPYFAPTELHRLSPGEIWYVLQGNASGETAGGDVLRQLLADPARLIDRTLWLGRHLAAQFGILGGPLAAAGGGGLVAIAARRPGWVLAAVLGAGGAAVFAMAYGKYPDADRYLLPLEALLALGLGCLVAAGATGMQRLLHRARVLARPVGMIAGLVLGTYWMLSFGILAGKTHFTRGGYVHHTLHNLDAVEPDAIVCSWWASAWGWWYAQFVDGHRPDVTVVAKGPDDCAREVLPSAFGQRPVYLPAMTDRVRSSPFVFFPSRDLWLAVSRRAMLVEGALLKGPDDKIYLYEGGRRRWVASLEVFDRRGLRWEQVQLTPDHILRDIPEGPPLGASDE